MSNRQTFLKRHASGIGGSDVGPICGLDPYRTALDVYLEKIGQAEDRFTPAMDAGIRLEPIIKDLFQEHEGRELQRARFRRHKKHRWLIGHPDALVAGLDPNWKPGKPVEHVTDAPGVFEAKCLNYHTFKVVVDKGIRPSHQLQGQHYTLLCKRPYTTFGFLDRSRWQFAFVTVEADAGIQEQMIATCEAFWYNHVIPRIPPKVETPQWVQDIPAVEGIVETRTDDKWRDLIAEFVEARQMVKDAGELVEIHKKSIKKLCGRIGVFDGGGAVVHYQKLPGNKKFEKSELIGAGLLDPIRLMAALEAEGYHLTTEELATIRAAAVVTNLEPWTHQGKSFEKLLVYAQEEE